MATRLQLCIAFICLSSSAVFGQQKAGLAGLVRDKFTQQTLSGVSLILEGTTQGAETDSAGRFRISGIAPKSYNLKAALIGYNDVRLFNLVVTSGNTLNVVIELEAQSKSLNEVTVKARSFGKSAVTPLSAQSLTAEEIRSNPGGNFDVSRVVQALPGVGGTGGSVGGFRNDIIIRGGAPNENVYYLDGIEIPTINHFSTQGSAGGPVGILNVSFIEDVSLASSAFSARYDNALSSVLQFKQRNGNRDRVQGNVRLSASEVAATLEGPVGDKTTFLVSLRRSYLQFLFKLIDLPIRPDYWDGQFKITHQFNPKTTLTFLGVGAIDKFGLGTPRETTPEKEYLLRAVAFNNQDSYTLGGSLKHLVAGGFWNLSLSRNFLNNRVDRFEDLQNGDESRRTIRLRSDEIENKLRFDFNRSVQNWRYAFGASAQYAQYNAATFNRIRKEITDENGQVLQPTEFLNTDSQIDLGKFGLFGELTGKFMDARLTATAGLRADGNTFTNDGANLLNTLSPRVALSYALTNNFNLNASVGRYYKLPIYTALGYRNGLGVTVNSSNKHIRSDHYVAGVEYLPTNSLRLTFEGFYKKYGNYPVQLRDGISLANVGADFGVIGSEPLQSTGNGEAYGLEVFVQQKLVNDFFATASYTLFNCAFTGIDGRYIRSAWDTRHLFSAILGKKFKRGWEAGLKYRFSGGAPFTPFDLQASQFNYASIGAGILDYGRYNTETLGVFNQADIRIDKKWNFKRTTLDLYVDVTNVFGFKIPSYPSYTFERNAQNTGFATTDNQPLKADGSNAIPIILNNNDGAAIPTIGFILEF